MAHKVAERLYGDDKVKCEFICHWITGVKKVNDILGAECYDEYTKSLCEGRLDEYIML